MTARGVRAARLLLLGAGLALAPGCTLVDDYVSGTPFRLEQPEAEVTLEGEIHVDPIALPTTGCSPGGTLLWGAVRNTGEVKVSDVSIVVETFSASGAGLGSFSGSVYSGEVIEGTGDPQFGTNLDVDQKGTFTICTPVPYGSVARTEHRTRFIVIDETGT